MLLTRIKEVAALLLAAVCVMEVPGLHPINAAEPPKAKNAIVPKPDWGEAVEGMQCRLQADRLDWAAGDWPSFTAGVRYRSDRPPGQERDVWVGDTQDHFSVEIDGRWFHPKAMSVPVPKVPFLTGSEKAGIPVVTKAG